MLTRLLKDRSHRLIALAAVLFVGGGLAVIGFFASGSILLLILGIFLFAAGGGVLRGVIGGPVYMIGADPYKPPGRDRPRRDW